MDELEKGNFNHNAANIKEVRLVLNKVYCYRALMYISKDVYNKSSESDIKLEYNFMELREALGINRSKSAKQATDIIYSTFKELGTGIQVKTALYTENGEDQYDYIEERLINSHKKIGSNIYLTVTPLCVSLINGFGGYTQIDRNIFNKLESSSHGYMYLLLKSYANKGKRTFSLTDFLIAMNAIDKKSYNKDLCPMYIPNIRKILLGVDKNGKYLQHPTSKQPYGLIYNINTNTDIEVTVQLQKNSSKEYEVEFTIQNKNIVIKHDTGIKDFEKFIETVKQLNITLFKKYLSHTEYQRTVDNDVYIHILGEDKKELDLNIFDKTIITASFNLVFHGKNMCLISDDEVVEKPIIENESWLKFLSIMKMVINEKEYLTWIEPIKFVSFFKKDDIETLTVSVPTKFFVEYIESHYLDELSNSIKMSFGKDVQLNYQFEKI